MNSLDDVRQNRRLVAELRRSRIFRDYKRAFGECTGLPLSLISGECFGLAQQGDARANPFCTLVAGQRQACTACLAFQRDLIQAVGTQAGTRECYAGLIESAVPVQSGGRIVAYLQTGQVLLQPPTAAQLRALEQRLRAYGIGGEPGAFAAAYARTRVVPREQHDAILRLLAIFALQLAEHFTRLAARVEVEPPAIVQARAFIIEHHTEEITLAETARAVNMSRYHFCKCFHRATAQTFTDFLARVRVEHVRQCLLNPETRISDAAYAAGFQSLSQFSRVFRRIMDVSPSTYRERPELARSA